MLMDWKSVEKRKEIMTSKLTMKRLGATSDRFMANLKTCEEACKGKIEELGATMGQLVTSLPFIQRMIEFIMSESKCRN